MGSTKKKSILRSRDSICKFCNKGFSSEKTLAAHMCPKKRRYADKDLVGSRLGFRIFQQFYEMNTKSTTPKTVMDFIFSRHYTGFVKFARYLVDLHPLDSDRFINHVIKNGFKMKEWTKPDVYEKWLNEHLRKEPARAALERGIITLDDWASKNNCSFTDFFSQVSTVEAVYLIRSGKISPWIIYISNSSSELLSRFNDEQSKMLAPILSSNLWSFVFNKRVDDVKYVSQILSEAGL